MEEAILKRIEAYFKGELNAGEKKAFEDQLKNDPELALQVNEFGKVFSTLHKMQNRNELRNRMNVLHEEINNSEKNNVVSLFYNLRKNKYKLLAAASLILVLVMSGIIYMLIHNKQQHNYLMLQRDLNEIKMNQHKLVQKMNSKKNLPTTPGKYSASAFMISPRGYLITSLHVIQDANRIMIENSAGELLDVNVIYKDKKTDMAVLQITDSLFIPFKALPYGFRKAHADLGEKVFTLGYPAENIVYEEGSLSARLGYNSDSVAYQISLSLNPGNSGGPLFDEQGNIIAMVSGKQQGSEGVGFATKMNYISKAIAEASEKDIKEKINLNGKAQIKALKRTEQLKKIEPFIYQVRVY